MITMLDASELQSARLGNILYLVSIVFLYYDHLLTLDSEIRLLWRRPRNFGGYLFFLNRYVAFFGNIVYTYSTFASSPARSSCRSWEIYYGIFQSITEGIVTAIFSLRVYALYGQRKSVLVIFTGIAFLGTAISVGLSFWSLDPSVPLEQGCFVTPSLESNKNLAIPWICLLAVDFVFFSMTIWKGYKMHFSMGLGTGTIRIGTSLVGVVLRDGSVYFLIVALSNIANIVSLRTSVIMQRHLTAPVGCLSVTLMSRMFLNMHKASETGIYTISTDSTPEDAHQSALRIRSPPQAQF